METPAHPDSKSVDHIRLIDLGRNLQSPLARSLWKIGGPFVNALLDIEGLNECYRAFLRTDPLDPNFFNRALRGLRISYEITEEDRSRIPRNGPIIIVANHPFGGVEGIILGALLTSVRPDVKLLVNYLLNTMPDMRPWTIAVDPFGGQEAARNNIGPIKECMKWLRQGGALGTFPSGTVSYLHWQNGKVTDPVWSDNIGALALRTGATVVPVLFQGRNPFWFQFIGLFHPRLRTAMLPRALARGTGRTYRLHVGKPIPPSRLEEFDSHREMTDFLRLKTYILQNRPSAKPRRRFPLPRLPLHPPARQDEVMTPIPAASLEREMASLPEEARLLKHGELELFCVSAAQIPLIMREIGRLREVTFREVGEGSGKACDLDDFDPYYLHLFMWNGEDREIVGAYRLGCTDAILAERGKNGLYTSTLFRFKTGFLEKLGPAIELGRSFIQSKYQRKYTSLSLIWRGIGEFIARHPRYRILFGPVSISQEYQTYSKNLMIQYLRQHSQHRKYSPMVKARRPPRYFRLGGLDRNTLRNSVKSIEDVSALVSEIEADQKGVPVLLRQYLKLNALLLSFNVDADFSNVLDGLMLVDLINADTKILRRYMGDEGAANFLKVHSPLPGASKEKTEGPEPPSFSWRNWQGF